MRRQRVAQGEANLIEALDKCFHLAGFGREYDVANLEIQPDTMILMMDLTPNAGAFAPDDKAIAAWLKKNEVKTLFGTLRWNGPQNYVEGSDQYKVKQLQQGKWM